MFRIKIPYVLLLFTVLGIALTGCRDKGAEQKQPEIAVANSYLYAAVRDLCGNDQELLSLVPPGMCPGHFDISPSQVNNLCNCKLLFVFDFQQNIENAIPRIKERGLKVCKVVPSPGMCIPDTYLLIVKQIAATLSEEYPSQKTRYELRLKEIENRLENLSQDISEQMKKLGLQNTKVIASQHQAEFAKWLGLNPVSTFAGRDTITPAQINRNLQEADLSRIKFIIANKQEGTELARTMAEHLKVKLVVFSNFPASRSSDIESGGDFDFLLLENLNNLLEVLE
jgi:ABC-type Zn uptake system ZnuABC Zn-binding protein ZnuA